MSFLREALREKPTRFWNLDDDTPYQEYSGSGASGTSASTATAHTALMYGSSWNAIFTNANQGTFASNVFKQGLEKEPFTIEAWVRPIEGTAGEQQIVGNSGQMDGLTWNGTTIAFVTKFSTTGEARAKYDLQYLRNVHVVGVHTREKNSLYINGELVNEVAITETQQADTFVTTSANLLSGATATTKKFAMGGLALYGTALTPEAIFRHFNAGRRIDITADTIAAVYGGTRIPLSQNLGDVFLYAQWTSTEDWTNATKNNVVVQDNQLRPILASGTSTRGEWIDTIPLQTDATSVYGVTIDWDGEGVTVQASVDGTTWASVTRGRNISVVPNGFNPQNKELNIKIIFAGGVADDPAFVDNLQVTGLKTGVIPKVDGRTATVTGSGSIKRGYHHADMHDNWGVELTGGTLTISTSDEPNPVNPRTLGIWVKRTSATALTLSFSAGQAYLRGTAVTQAVATPVNEWSLVHWVMGAAITGTITITGDAQIGDIILYEDAKTTTQLAEMSAAYIGPIITPVGDTSVIAMSEPATSVAIYAQDWTIVAAR